MAERVLGLVMSLFTGRMGVGKKKFFFDNPLHHSGWTYSYKINADLFHSPISKLSLKKPVMFRRICANVKQLQTTESKMNRFCFLFGS